MLEGVSNEADENQHESRFLAFRAPKNYGRGARAAMRVNPAGTDKKVDYVRTLATW